MDKTDPLLCKLHFPLFIFFFEIYKNNEKQHFLFKLTPYTNYLEHEGHFR